MAGQATKAEGLEAFERLPLSELYFIGDRRFLERGLAYYRTIAVEKLSWSARQKRIKARVSGNRQRPYAVTLRVRGGQLEHACECPAWSREGGCKHAVAATAAMFLAVQGKRAGGIEMPADYARELRQQLGYTDVGGGGGDAPKAPAKKKRKTAAPKVKTELVLREIHGHGGLSFGITGPIPSRFLRAVGIKLPNSYGFYGSREFGMGTPETTLGPFLRKAASRGIGLSVRIDGRTVPLSEGPADCGLRVVFDLAHGQIVRRLEITDGEGEVLPACCLIEQSSWILLEDGRLCRPRLDNDVFASSYGPLEEAFSVEGFNEKSWQLDHRAAETYPEAYGFRVDGADVPVTVCEASAVRRELHLSLIKNAAEEPEALAFELRVSADGGPPVPLAGFADALLRRVTGTFGSNVFSAKRRVRALMVLLRRVIAEREGDAVVYLNTYADDFPELLSDTYGPFVADIVEGVLGFVDFFGDDYRCLSADAENRRWLAYPFDGRRTALLLLYLAEPLGRYELENLERGRIPLRRGTSGMEEVSRAVRAAASLGVEVRYNDAPVRCEPVSVSVETRPEEDGIDWFELHPSVRCGDRTIAPEEWDRLIHGELLLEAGDGGLVLPQAAGEGADGLRGLADIFGERKAKKRKGGSGGGLRVSRLEMLDWIALRQQGVEVRLPEEAETLFRSLTEFTGLESFEPPSELRADLRPYQREGCAWIDFLYRHRFGACLADDMGLGKTVQAIAFLARRFEAGLEGPDGAPVLAVLPPSLVFNWLDEFARFAPHLRVVDCLRKNRWASALAEAQVVLTTYDRMRTDIGKLGEHRFAIVIFDEAHHLKNVSAARTKAAAKLNRRFTLCLTGTPLENNATEFYSVMTAAVPGIFGELTDFKKTYRDTPERVLGRSRPFVLRRTKTKILKELPQKEEHELHLEMSALQKEIYTRTVAEVRAEVAEAYEDRPAQQAGIAALSAILRLRQVCVSPELMGKAMPSPAPKFAYLADKMEELLAEGHAALVFSQFIGGLDGLEAVARERGIDYVRMDGRTPVGERKECVRRFQEPGGPHFFFISLRTGGVGLNLTRANYVFHLDPWWNPAVENQASDRAHRIGQTQSVFVQRLIMQHSIEARMMELKAKKADLFRQLVEDPGAGREQSGLTRGDFEYLLNDA